MYCSYCGKEIADGIKFCPKCGKATYKNMPKSEGKRVEGKEKSNKVWWILGIAFSIVVLIIAFYTYKINLPENRIVGTWYELEDYETINYSVEVTFLEDGVVSSDDEIGTYYLTDDEVIVLFDDIKRSLYFYDPEYSLDKMMIDEYKDVLAMDYDGKTYLYVKEK